MMGAVMGAVAITNTSLRDFDNLHSNQLNLGAAVLQHLLSCGQHLLILDSDTSQRQRAPRYHRGKETQLPRWRETQPQETT